MSAALRPSVADIEAQIAEARKWLYPGAVDYLVRRHTAVIEILEQVLRENPDDHEIRQMSEAFEREEQAALGRGDTQGAIAPGVKFATLEWLRGKFEEPVEEFD